MQEFKNALILIVAVVLVSCSGASGESEVDNDPINMGKVIGIHVYSDNPAINGVPVVYDLNDSFAPCSIYYCVSALDMSGDAFVTSVEVAIDRGPWQDVTMVYPLWKYTDVDRNKPNIEHLLREEFNELGVHQIDARVSFSDGDVIFTGEYGTSSSYEFNVIASPDETS